MKAELKKGVEKKRMETYEQKGLQSDLYRRQEQEYHLWLRQRLTPRKTASDGGDKKMESGEGTN